MLKFYSRNNYFTSSPKKKSLLGWSSLLMYESVESIEREILTWRERQAETCFLLPTNASQSGSYFIAIFLKS